MWAAFNILPPGLGAIVVGFRNPHARLLRNGILQMMLVVAGSWPLIVPGAIGFVWAVRDAVRISRAELVPRPPPPSKPNGSPPVAGHER
jgi:hypothetical protein